MDFDHTFALLSAWKYGAFHVETDLIHGGHEVFLGEMVPQGVVVYKHFSGGRVYDLVGTTHGSICLVSERVCGTLRGIQATGWDTFPVEVYHKKHGLLTGYHGFVVTGRCGSVDLRKARREMRQRVPQGKPYLAGIGLYFDPDTWDGSDVFTSKTMYVPMVTEKVKDALMKAKITNIEFEALSEYEIPGIDIMLEQDREDAERKDKLRC